MEQINKTNDIDDDINISQIIEVFLEKKVLVVSVTLFFAIFSVIYALSLPNIYTSKSLLAPTAVEDSLSTQLSSYSSIANLAGVSLLRESATKSAEAIARMQSYEFFSEFIVPSIGLENIIAVKEWDSLNNKIIYDKNLYDVNTGKWVDDTKTSQQKAFEVFLSIFSLSVDRETSFVNISIQHKSPFMAKKLLETIIFNINESMRSQDIRLAEASINYLNESKNLTQLQSLQEGISNLLENQMQTLMLASSNESYVFKVIDSPIAPERKSGPVRSIICIVITMIGGFLSLIAAYFQHLRESKNI